MRAMLFAAAAALAACGQNANPGAGAGAAQQASAGGAVFPSTIAAAYRLEATLHAPEGAMPIVMQADGPRMRMEFRGGQAVTMIANTETGEALSVVQVAGQTVAMRSDVGAPSFRDPLKDWKDSAATNATHAGACSGAGETGSLWTQTQDGVPHTACVTADGIMLSAAAGGQTVWETTSIQRGPQPASAFELPPGVRVVDPDDLGSMIEVFGGGRP
ncbi:MAG TPA: hypothetical protein PLK37_02855 [Terricaulis sp.]|nr:hypothetical protein [Terricaulis sp.]